MQIRDVQVYGGYREWVKIRESVEPLRTGGNTAGCPCGMVRLRIPASPHCTTTPRHNVLKENLYTSLALRAYRFRGTIRISCCHNYGRIAVLVQDAP